MKRKVAKLISPKTFVIEQEEIPPLKKDEVLVKIEACGICHTEMSTFLGESVTIIEGLENYRFQKEIPYPVELGHEPSGIVLDIGSEVKDFKMAIGLVVRLMDHLLHMWLLSLKNWSKFPIQLRIQNTV
jgi:D-arabinose 1-dehydrogenase-like Zn-dependent alcohol dehydrogenase